MQQCKKILVGVDLSAGDWQVADEIPASTQSLINHAAEVARAADGELVLQSVIELDPKTQWLLDHYGSGASSVLDRAHDAIHKLVSDLKSHDVRASGSVALGKAWVELTKQGNAGEFDVVMVGTKRLGGVLGWLVGSTGRQLLRNCKSPVWIHKNTTRAPIEAVLVATDFSPVADESLELGVRVAAAENATLHLLHVASLPSDSLLSWGNVAADKLDRARDHLLSDAKGELAQRFATIDRDLLSKEPRQHLLTGEPADVIADQVKQHKIDLLVMGTQTHQKEAWFTMGSTAERLLTTLDCSLLAVKPADFVSPIHQ